MCVGQDITDKRVLEIAKQQDLEITRLDVHKVIGQALESVRESMEQNRVGIESNVREGTLIYADPERITRAITTVLSDAVSNSLENRSVRIESVEQEMYVLLKIIVHRPLIPPEELESIFERYKQPGISESYSAQRSNVSLALAKAIMNAHGGSLWITSFSIEGTVFGLTVPKASIQSTFTQ